MALLKEDALIPGRSNKLTFGEFAEPFWIWDRCPIVTDKILRGYKFSQTLCRNNLHSMRKNILPTFGDYLLTDITPDMVNRWLLSLIRVRIIKDKKYPPLANSTANKMLRILKDMLDVAVKRELIPSNPAKSVHKLADNYRKRGTFTVEEAKRILENKDVWDNPLAWLGSYLSAMTGMRQGEIRALVKEDVKDSYLVITHSYDRTVGTKSTKADKERQIPIPGKLRDELLRWAPEKGFIFSVDNGVSPVSPDSLLDGLYARLEDLGIDHEKRNLCFHSWRHFFNTRLIASGVQGEITRAIVGHESEDMTERYLHLTASDMEVVARVQNELVKVVG
jgi:integrase